MKNLGIQKFSNNEKLTMFNLVKKIPMRKIKQDILTGPSRPAGSFVLSLFISIQRSATGLSISEAQ